jgi:hypothetical protein
MRRIVHLVNDQKFVDHARRLFERVAPGQNEFYLFSNAGKNDYLSFEPDKRYSRLDILRNRFFPHFDPDIDLLVVHGLHANKIRYLNRLRGDCTVVWIGMGFDYYDLIGTELLKPDTNDLCRKMQGQEAGRQAAVRFLERLLYGPLNKAAAIKKIDYFCPVLPNEYDVLKNRPQGFSPRFLSWNYNMALSNLEQNFQHARVSGSGVLVGNSGTYSNNHIEAFDLLKGAKISARQIYTPLSYGDADYAREIAERGKAEFGDQFIPLTDFMPMQEYIETLSRCNQVIMNHKRQQAIGNIIIMLFLGAKVYLDKENIAYDYFVREGVTIYTLEEFRNEPDARLSESEIMRNRSVLARHFSDEEILRKTGELVDLNCA